MRVVVTKHAYSRAHERLGLTAPAFKKLCAMGYSYGLPLDCCRGPLRNYLQQRVELNKNTDAFIYGDNVYLMTGNRIVTVYALAASMRVHLKRNLQAHEKNSHHS